MESNKQSPRHLFITHTSRWDKSDFCFATRDVSPYNVFFLTSDTFHTINLVKNLNICEFFLCFTDLLSWLCQRAYFLMWLIKALSCFIFVIFYFLQGPHWNFSTEENCFRLQFFVGFVCLVFVFSSFSFWKSLGIFSFIREKTGLWFMGLTLLYFTGSGILE